MKIRSCTFMMGILVTTLGGTLAFSDTQPYSGKKRQVAQTPTQSPPAPMSSMSQDEMDFAAGLSDMHKMIFTSLFTPEMRSQAMSLYASKMGAMNGKKNKTMMTEDEAVEQVIKNNRGVQMKGDSQGALQQQGMQQNQMNSQAAPQQKSMNGSNQSQNSMTNSPQNADTPKKKKYYWD